MKKIYTIFNVLSVIIFCSVMMMVAIESVVSSWSVVPISCLMYFCLSIVHQYGIGKHVFWLCFPVSLVLFVMAAYFMQVNLSWDAAVIFENARALVLNHAYNREYFSCYPNNLAILLIATGVFLISNFIFCSVSVFFLSAVNIAAIVTSIFFLVCIARHLYGSEVGYLTGIILLLYAPFYFYIPIFYTDTICLPFMTAGVYFGILALEKRWWLLPALSGISFSIGFIVKGSVVVALIAVLMSFLMMPCWRVRFIKMLIVIICFGGCILIWNKCVVTKFLPNDERETLEFPLSHWILMGLHGRGGYNQADVDYTSSISGCDLKKSKINKKIVDWIVENGCGGLLCQFYKKACRHGWQDGLAYSAFVLGDHFQTSPKRRNFVHEFLLNDGRYKGIGYVLTQGYYFCIVILCIICFVRKLLSNVDFVGAIILRLIPVGAILFFMIWETCPRYTFDFVPFLISLAAPEIAILCSQQNRFL